MLLLLFWATGGGAAPVGVEPPVVAAGTPATVRLTVTARAEIVLTVAEE